MCGIWLYLSKLHAELSARRKVQLFAAQDSIQPRGPDRSHLLQTRIPLGRTGSEASVDALLAFHRLSIMDRSTQGDQPFVLECEARGTRRTIYVMCNGEIYNFHELIERYDLECKSGSDCEVDSIAHAAYLRSSFSLKPYAQVIPLLFARLGFAELVTVLEGEFAFSILEVTHRDDVEEFGCGGNVKRGSAQGKAGSNSSV